MTKKEITINGKTYPVIFTLKTLSNFEEIVNKSFFEANLNTTNSRIAMVVAAALAADKDSKLTVEECIGNNDWEAYKQIGEAYAIVMKLAESFFPIPEVEPKDEKPADEQTDDDKPKN